MFFLMFVHAYWHTSWQNSILVLMNADIRPKRAVNGDCDNYRSVTFLCVRMFIHFKNIAVDLYCTHSVHPVLNSSTEHISTLYFLLSPSFMVCSYWVVKEKLANIFLTYHLILELLFLKHRSSQGPWFIHLLVIMKSSLWFYIELTYKRQCKSSPTFILIPFILE